MSTCYYLVEINKKKEFEKLNDFWENVLFTKTKEMISKYFEENKGDLINDDLLDDIMDDKSISALKYCPVYDDSFSTRIGSSTATNFYWDYGSLNLGSVSIYDYNSLKKFIDENPSYSIYDEYGTPIPLKEFKLVTEKSTKK